MSAIDPELRWLDLQMDQQWQEALEAGDLLTGFSLRSTLSPSLSRASDRIRPAVRVRRVPDDVRLNELANVAPISPLRVDARVQRKHIENTVRGWPIKFDREYDRRVDDIQFPNVVGLYLEMFVRSPFPDTPKQFLEMLTRNVIAEHSEIPESAIRNRALKFLCSLIRQHHFSQLLQEHFDFVIWSERLDRHFGIDLLVIQDASVVAIGMSMDGETAAQWRSAKQRRQLNHDAKLPTISINARRSQFPPRTIWLHGAADVESVRSHFVRFGGGVEQS